jgi:hypothetical protein
MTAFESLLDCYCIIVLRLYCVFSIMLILWVSGGYAVAGWPVVYGSVVYGLWF